MIPENVNLGNTPNDGLGDKLRDAFEKINNHNHDDVYAKLNGVNSFVMSNYNAPPTATKGLIINVNGVKRWLIGSYDAESGGNTGSQLRFIRYDDQGGAASFVMLMDRSNNSIKIGGSGTPTERLEVVGNVKATSFITSSDKRLKENIKPIKKIDLSKLKPVSFNFKNDKEKITHFGLIAQEAKDVIPEIVKGSGKKINDVIDYYSINYIEIIPLLISEIKELKEKIEKLSK